jgi:hypothetical protein
VRTTSHDPDLDLLIIRFHLAGARREGALNLRLRDLDCLAPGEVRYRARATDIAVVAAGARTSHVLPRGDHG